MRNGISQEKGMLFAEQLCELQVLLLRKVNMSK